MIEWVEQLRAGLTGEFGTGPKIVTLATVDEGGAPRARSVVVRMLRDDGALLVACDIRSDKDVQLRIRPRAEVCAWLPSLRRQFRVAGDVDLFSEPTGGPAGGEAVREQVWAEMSDSARALFFWPRPGAPRVWDNAAFPQAVGAGLSPSNFEVLCLTPTSADVLDLVGHPHRRRRWTRHGAEWDVRDVNP
jgi:pyridoxamine 5'-phosphate oxidase